LWKMMMMTHNVKYPDTQISEEDLSRTREKIGSIEEKEMTRTDIHRNFDERVNLFYFGIYSKHVRCLDEDDVSCPRTEQVNTVTPGHGFLTQAEKERFAKEKEEKAKLLEEKRTRLAQENLRLQATKWRNKIVRAAFFFLAALCLLWFVGSAFRESCHFLSSRWA